ncbi:MAG: hypothetical protein A2177_11715 [Spirochaetes bacterium RBG_13_68_11]|nr:MAG: hypothetical protein A2177_11715 [Spirochaetes bacterium RBG_13_68_11]
MKTRLLSTGLFLAALAVAPLAAQDTAPAANDEDIFGQEEEVTQTTDQTQNAAPRDAILTSAVPWIAGSFTGTVGLDWNWSDVWGSGSEFLNPTSYGLSQSATGVKLGFVARPAADISVTGQVRTSYPFVKEIVAVTSVIDVPPLVVTTTTYLVPDFTVWSLYSKFTWNDALFFTFGKQPLKWGTGYFFSPADDIFARSEVDLANPTAEREGPLALKVHYPIPRTMHNLYAFAVLPAASGAAALAAMKPEDIAVAAKAEVLLGNTELALAGYYQRNQRPEAILTGSTGTGDFNFFAECTVAFPSPVSENYIEATGPSTYALIDRSAETLFSTTAGAIYTNADWNFTAVAQYLYNGYGYSSLNLGDLIRAILTVPGASSLVGTFSGLGKIGQHYAVAYLGWTSLWDSDWDLSVLAIENFSDLSGYVKPALSFSCFGYVKLSGSVSLSWGGEGTEFADPAGLVAAMRDWTTIASFVAKPSLSLSLTASIGSTSF